MTQSDNIKKTKNYDKILIISDVHGLIEELREFLDFIKNKYQDTVAYGVHLGDFFKGRNVIKGQKTFTFWKDINYIDQNFPFPIYCIKGNEDINIPNDWWTNTGLISLIPDRQEFMLDDFRIIPIHFFDESKEYLKENGIRKIVHLKQLHKTNQYNPLFDYIPTKENISTDILTDSGKIDFVMAHVPPYGLLDKTRDYSSHKEIKFTGNKFIRLVVDKRKPRFVFFGHNHFCNYKIFEKMIVISIDKFCRKIPIWAEDNYLDFNYKRNRKYTAKKSGRKGLTIKTASSETEKSIFSYCLITKSENKYLVEIFRKNSLVFQYDVNMEKILHSSL